MEAQEFKQAAKNEVQILLAERATTLARLEWIDRKLAAWNVVLEDEPDFTPSVRVKPEERAKTIELVKELIMASGKTGMLPREVRAELQRSGVVTGSQVVTNALSRWKLRDYTVEIDGRHYWKAYLSEEEIQKAKPRLRRGSARQAWGSPTGTLTGT